jgi:hypothetical protein
MAQVWLVTGSSRGLGRAIAVCSNGQNSISETRMRDTQNENRATGPVSKTSSRSTRAL